ncbi:MAG: carbohydrate ABC transporter permease [Fimbriimonadaceae bacterium]|nr:carbohydrate ABC transporter permease [Fimbriimonadaceae bacterium]
MASISQAEFSHRQAKQLAKRAELSALLGRGFTLFILFFGAAIFLIPFYVMLAISLKSQAELGSTDIWSWPKQPTFENFQTVLTNRNVSFEQFFRNTAFIATMTTIGVLFSSSVVAYAFARLNFAGRDRLFLVLLSTMMLPGIVTMIPTYVMYARIGWINSFLPLIVPAFFGGGAFNIFLLRQFYLGIPRELDEAAFLDGAGYFTIFARIILPLSGPALATVGIFCFMYNWKDFMGPLLYLNDPTLQNNEMGLSTYNALQAAQWHLIMAGSVIVMIPIVILFLIGQRAFIKGIVMTGGK